MGKARSHFKIGRGANRILTLKTSKINRIKILHRESPLKFSPYLPVTTIEIETPQVTQSVAERALDDRENLTLKADMRYNVTASARSRKATCPSELLTDKDK
jgi:hypothetical protein